MYTRYHLFMALYYTYFFIFSLKMAFKSRNMFLQIIYNDS
jgi:hypothetical protein